MNYQTRAQKYLEAKEAFENQQKFFKDRLDRARYIIYSVYRKQYTSKLTSLDVDKVIKSYHLENKKLIIEEIIPGYKGARTAVIKVTEEQIPSRENYWTGLRKTELDPVLVYGSDRDIAKLARRVFDNEYASIIKRKLNESSDSISYKRTLLQDEIGRKEKELERINESKVEHERKYENVKKHREKKVYG